MPAPVKNRRMSCARQVTTHCVCVTSSLTYGPHGGDCSVMCDCEGKGRVVRNSKYKVNFFLFYFFLSLLIPEQLQAGLEELAGAEKQNGTQPLQLKVNVHTFDY